MNKYFVCNCLLYYNLPSFSVVTTHLKSGSIYDSTEGIIVHC